MTVDESPEDRASSPVTNVHNPARPAGAWVAIVGGALAAAGTVLPWISATAGFATVTRTGLEMGQDALIIAGAGVLGALFAFVSPRFAGYALALVGGLVVLFVGWLDFGDLSNRVGDLGSLGYGSVGAGIYVCLAGGLLMAVGGLMALTQRR